MMFRFSTLLCTTLLITASFSAQAQAPRTFSEAKKVAWGLYAPQSTEFYCGCKYTGNRVDIAGCGLFP
ncbi:deoxyribonuclease I, partial [Pseudomonas savastanoi pv. glycinea str. race 4]